MKLGVIGLACRYCTAVIPLGHLHACFVPAPKPLTPTKRAA